MSLFKKFFFSMESAAVLLIIFAISSGVATFIESIYNTQTAWALVYGAGWFALIQLLLGINLIYNMFRYKLFTCKKLPAAIFHMSFIFILVGAAATRYLGFEGQMHIRENDFSDEIITSQSHLQLKAIDANETVSVSRPVYVSSTGFNKFSLSLQIGGKKATLSYDKLIPNAADMWVESKDGEPVLEIMFSNDENSKTVTLLSGDSVEVGDVSFTFNDKPKQKKFINITLENGEFFIDTNVDLHYMKMADMSKGDISKNKKIKFANLSLYSFDGINFAPKTMLASAVRSVKQLQGNAEGNDAILAKLNYNGETKEVYIFNAEPTKRLMVGGVAFGVAWSPVDIRLPFRLHLNDFELARYPGSNSPMSYSSQIEVQNNKGDKIMDYQIYMNHVLDYDGYRFFQSSYDLDEGGTILSVNKDPGKIPTYIGYFLLGLGLFLNILNPYSRFRKLARSISDSNAKSLAVIFMFAFGLFCGNLHAANVPYIDANHAKELSGVIVQSQDGRMKPFDTVSHEILNKLYRSDKFDGIEANRVVLSMMVNSSYWRTVPIIKVSDNRLRNILGLTLNQKYASFNDFFGENSKGEFEYKLIKYSELANRKSPATRNQFDKDVIKADEKLNILYMVFMGELFRVIPKQDDANHTWYSPTGVLMQFSGDELKNVSSMLENYFTAVANAQSTNNWTDATKALDVIIEYQKKYGHKVYPSDKKIEIEMAFNKYKIFENLTPVYLISGLALLIVVFVRMVKPKLKISTVFFIFYLINIIAFVAHTIGLGLRWYIAEHAPWSDSYESMIYIAWALAFSGIVFSRKSAISLALTSILAGVTLFVAHLSWLDPQITTLAPVLKSYWLTIHVSVITASYGFLGLCSLLGCFTLVLFALHGKKENIELSRNILEATRINEMAMILGLSLLVFGNFLGGVWANESWGRYWGWDSKETWALVSILVYAAVVHMRFIPRLNSQFSFAVASMFAYLAIIMTYFGVNFYLTGMHSYAAGDPVPVPNFVWIGLSIMVLLCILAYRNSKYSKTL